MDEYSDYKKAVKFGESLEKVLPWVLLLFFSGLGCGYAWAFYHYQVLG